MKSYLSLFFDILTPYLIHPITSTLPFNFYAMDVMIISIRKWHVSWFEERLLILKRSDGYE